MPIPPTNACVSDVFNEAQYRSIEIGALNPESAFGKSLSSSVGGTNPITPTGFHNRNTYLDLEDSATHSLNSSLSLPRLGFVRFEGLSHPM